MSAAKNIKDKTALNTEFPGWVEEKSFVEWTVDALKPHGFNGPNSIACFGACRDEICARPFADDVTAAWGEAFNFSSLAGMLTLGKTGFGAAKSHAPKDKDGKERFVFIVMPHIGVDASGTLGKVHREGQDHASSACGALMALKNEVNSGAIKLDLDPEDIEMSLLRQRMFPLIFKCGTPPAELGLAELTKLSQKASFEDLEKLIGGASNMSNVDYAVFSGVQIHAPDGDLVFPANAYVVVDGVKSDIMLPGQNKKQRTE